RAACAGGPEREADHDLAGRNPQLFRARLPAEAGCSAGTLHDIVVSRQQSGMIGSIIVMNPADYEAWLSGGGGEGSLASTGQKLFQQLGCGSCHRSDTQGRGPNLVGVFGKPVLLEDGRTVTADENYVRESILNPGAKIVAGFKNIMPSFQGVVNEEQLLSLIAYVKSLQGSQPGGIVSNRPAVPNVSVRPRVK